ncbi:diacylglycerol kinase family protein [Alkalibacillus silvisoli]|uniref:Diacylglycerol kinase family lipid kinase n=1 Tax=Alkalibacillus silvisoli TaxID=392823 RepID=A0ABN0ZQK8_9BACI
MYALILNPKAGNGKSKSVYQKMIKQNHINEHLYKMYVTKYQGHATEIVQQIKEENEQVEKIIVIGGDGTLYEVINGIKKSNLVIQLAFIPAGSGNDFARGCQIHLNPYKQIKQLFTNPKTIQYWFGQYEVNEDQYLFASSIGFGFDAEVAKVVNESRLKKWFNALHLAPLIYVYGLLMTIFKYKPKTLSLNVDGECIKIDHTWLITVSNHPYFGGGMKIALDAEVNPNNFTITTVNNISRWKLLFLFITVFFGKHTKLKEVHTFEAKEIKLSSEVPIMYQADGYTNETQQCVINKEQESITIIK